MSKLAFLAALAVATSLLAVAGPVSAKDSDLQACARWQNHLFEVCAAYVFNDASFSLQPYYKYVHSDSILAPLGNRFFLKYKGQAQQLLKRRVASWPHGTNEVEGPDIRILSARSSLSCNRGVLITRESWRVTSQNGRTLYNETAQLHTVLLRRVPDQRFKFGSHVLHAWVVYNLYNGRRNIQPTC